MIGYNSSNFTQQHLEFFHQQNLEFAETLSDAEVRARIQSSPGVQKPDKLARITRIDGIDNSNLGYVSCLGTKAVLAERILSALHHFHSGAISAIVFICDSKEMAWWKQNSDKTTPTAGDGNRGSAKDMLSHLKTLAWIEIPVMIYTIQTDEAVSSFRSFHEQR